MKAGKDSRLFAPFPIEMDEHPKIAPLSDAAFRALFEATFYARRMLSDGFLDERIVLKRWGQAVADELSSNDRDRPSWVRVEGGWQIHDFEKHHPLKAEIEERRLELSEKRSKAGKAGNESRWGGKPDATDSQVDRKPIANDRSHAQTQSQTQEKKIKNSSSEAADAPIRPDVEQLLDLLDSEIRNNGAKVPNRTKKNADAARLLLDLDGYTFDQVAYLIRWSQHDEFWRSNILSMSNLRAKADTLKLQIKRGDRATKKTNAEEALEMAARYAARENSHLELSA